jgi:hypothetical protein
MGWDAVARAQEACDYAALHDQREKIKLVPRCRALGNDRQGFPGAT